MNCPAGKIATAVTNGATTATEGCDYCLPGTYSLGGDATSCSPSTCPAGQMANRTGATTATNGTVCATGTFSLGGALTTCSAMNCPAGKFAAPVANGAKTDTDGCTNCLPGTFSLGVAATSCTTCPADKVSAEGASICIDSCLVGYKKEGQKCIKCEAGT